jgi:hypothetical protein
MQDHITSTKTIGESLTKSENADRITPADKQAFAWSEMLRLYGKTTDGLYVPSAYRYLVEKESDFDLWLFTEQGSVNSLDI